jgi:soluble lytic murein transglycosylase-like protein
LGLRYGIRHLLKFYTKYGDWPDALAAYNAGSPRKAADGKYLNQSYVDKVLKFWTQFERHIPIITSPETT